MLAELWKGFPSVFDSIVPQAPAYADASRKGQPVSLVVGRSSPEARRFALLAEEIETLMARAGTEEERDDSRYPNGLL